MSETKLTNKQYVAAAKVFMRHSAGCVPNKLTADELAACLQYAPDPRIAAADAMAKALKALVGRLYVHGNWDDGCFYYNKVSATELESPLGKADAALAAYNAITAEADAPAEAGTRKAR